MNTQFIPAHTRWVSEIGWLSSRFSFSFADYYDPKRMGFGALRVINDDTIAAGSGFGMHPHRDMEIVTIVFDGTITHEDSMGNKGSTTAGEIQMMSAGRGVLHSEVNTDPMFGVKLLQIWIIPNVLGVTPRYGQAKYEVGGNSLVTLVSSPAGNGRLHILQDARICLGKYEAGKSGKLEVSEVPGVTLWVYAFVVDGKFEIDGQVLGARDALEITDAKDIPFTARESGRILFFEVPMF